MLKEIRTAATALFVGLLINSPILAQTPETVEQIEKKLQELRALQAKQAELKKAAEQLDQLLKQAKVKEATQATPGVQLPANPAPANPAVPVARSPQGQATPQIPRPGVGTWSVQQVPDTMGAIKGLTLSRDPKIAAAAKELLDLHIKANPAANPAPQQNSYNPAPQLGSKPVELKVEGGFVLMSVGGGESSLKLSADGKKAAVTGTDGTVTVYDVTTGKELMKFPAKK